MAVIGKIRSYSGLLIAVIGIALAAFVLGDFMGYGPTGQQDLEVGSVERTKIMYPEFESRVAQQTENWRNQTGNQNVGSREAFQIRQQVWNQMLREILLANEFEKLGISVSSDELTELVIGDDPHPAVLQSFSNPQDGSFDPQTVVEFIQNLNMMEPSMQNQWFMLEDYIREERKETKYHSLIQKGFYLPEALASADYQNKNAFADFRAVVKRYNQIDDTLVDISNRELRNTYDDHKYKFEREKSRDLEYVVFPIHPSELDRENAKNEIERLKLELAETDNVESFINANSDQRFDPNFYAQEELSPQIDSLMFNAEEGTIYGPYEEDNAFVVAKLNEIQFRPDSMQASHILVSHQMSQSASPETTRTPERASELADSLLNVVRNAPGRFDQLAIEFSDDPSAMGNQGDLGWFPDGAMVPAFNEAVLENPVNSFTVVESEFGFHVIHITGKSPESKKVQVALLTRDIVYSNQTFQRVYGEASAFASDVRDNDDFDAVVEDHGLSKRVADNVRPMDNTIPGIDQPRNIIQWAFGDRTEEGSISQIFDLQGRFVVARLAKARDEGVAPLDEIRDEIMEIAIREKKAQMIKEEFENAGGETLDQKAESLGLEVRTFENIAFSANTLQGMGNEPAVIGSAFALQPNNISAPIEGNAGVFLIEVTNKHETVVPENLTAQQEQLKNAFRNRVPNDAFRAIQESAEVEDRRHRFY